MTTNNLLIFDKDGTLTTPRSGTTFVQHPEDQMLLPNVAETIARYREDGWSMAIASNQGGCDSINPKTGKPFKAIDETVIEMRFAMDLTGIERSAFCPKMDGYGAYAVSSSDTYYRSLGCCECKDFVGFRKPDPGMLLWFMASDQYDRVLFVGDRIEDQNAAIAAGVEFQWAKDFFGWEA